MPARPVPLRAVTTLFLERQHLSRPRVLPLTTRRLLRFVEDAGGLQLDSINVLDRAHYLTVWARFGPYERAWLDRLLTRKITVRKCEEAYRRVRGDVKTVILFED